MSAGWQGRGACVGQQALFFPPVTYDAWGNQLNESPNDRIGREYEASLLCKACPVQTQCRAYALGYEDETGFPLEGFWGGMNSADIKRVRKGGSATIKLPAPGPAKIGRPAKQPEDVEHGTHAGYIWHTKSGVSPCNPCRIARRQAKAAQRRRAQERKQP